MLSGRPNRRDAFTLIELMVVIVILGLMSAIASVSLGGAMARYQLQRAAEGIESFDQRVRRDSRLQREPREAIIRRGKEEWAVRQPSSNQPAPFAYRLPRHVEIEAIKLPRKGITGSDVTIPYNDRGQSPTYAVQLRRGTMTRWLVVLGVSGQVLPLDSEEQVDALLSP